MTDSVAGLFVEIEAREAISTLARLARQSEASGAKVDDVGDKAEKTSRRLGQMSRSASAAGGMMTRGLTVPLTAIGALSIKMATDFNAGMANVATLIPGNISRIQELKSVVQELAVETGKRTGDLSDGLYQVVSAFGDSADSAEKLRINAKAAAGGLAATRESINLTSAVTKGYGDTTAEAVQKAADLALLTVRLGQTTFPELAASIGRVTPLAAELKVEQEELFAVFATGTGVVGNAAEVSTRLQAAMLGLVRPTKDMEATLADLGISSVEAAVAQDGLVGTLRRILSATDGSTEAISKLFESGEALTLILALAGGQADVFDEKLASMAKSAGTTDEAFREQTKGVNEAGFAWQQLLSGLQVAAQQIGDALIPVLLEAAESLRPLLDGALEGIKTFGELPGPVKVAALAIAGLAVAAGPVLLVFGQLLVVLPAMAPVLTSLAMGFGTLVAAISPLALLLGGIALAATAAGGKLKEWASEMQRDISVGVREASRLGDAFGDMRKALSGELDLTARDFEVLDARIRIASNKIRGYAQELAGTSWRNVPGRREELQALIREQETLIKQYQVTKENANLVAASTDAVATANDGAADAAAAAARTAAAHAEAMKAAAEEAAALQAALDSMSASLALQASNLQAGLDLIGQGMDVALVDEMVSAANQLNIPLEEMPDHIAGGIAALQQLQREFEETKRIADWWNDPEAFGPGAGPGGQVPLDTDTAPVKAQIKEVGDEWEAQTQRMGQDLQGNLESFARQTFATFLAEGEFTWDGMVDGLKRILISAFADYLVEWIKVEAQRVAANAKANATIAAQNTAAAQAGGGASGGAPSGGGAAGGGAAMGVMAAFVAFYLAAEARSSHNAEKYGGGTVFSGGAGGVDVGIATAQGLDVGEARQAAQEMEDALTQLALTLGIATGDLQGFRIELNKESGMFSAFVGNVLVAEVNNLEAAFDAALRHMLIGVETMSPNLQKAVERAIGTGASGEELAALVDLAMQLDGVHLSDSAQEMREILTEWGPLFADAKEAGMDLRDAISLLGERLGEVRDDLQSQLDQFLDPTGALDSVAAMQALEAELIGYNEELARQQQAVSELAAEEIRLADIREDLLNTNPISTGGGQSPTGGDQGQANIDNELVGTVSDWTSGLGDLANQMLDTNASLDDFSATFGDAFNGFQDTSSELSNIADQAGETAGALGGNGGGLAGALGDAQDAADGLANQGDIVVGVVDDVAGGFADVVDALPDPIELTELARAQQALSDQISLSLGNELLQYVGNSEIRQHLLEAEHRLKMLQFESEFAALVALGQLTDLQLGAFRAAIDTFGAAGPGTIRFPTGGGGGGHRPSAQDTVGDDRDRLREILADRAFEQSLIGMTEVQAGLARLNRQREEEILLAHGSAELIAQINEQFDLMAQTLQRDTWDSAVDAFREFMGLGAHNDSPFQSLKNDYKDLVEQMTDAGFTPDQLANALARLEEEYRAQLAAILDLERASIMDPFESAMDQASGTGSVERELLDTLEMFAQAEDALRELAADAAAAGLSTEWLAEDLAALEAAQSAVIRQLGVDFVGSLGALGASIPDDVVMELAQAQWQLARVQAIAAAMALAAAGAFEGLSFTLEDIVGWINEADFDMSDWAPPTLPTGGFGAGGGSGGSTFDELQRILDEIRRWELELADAELDPFTRQLVQMQRRFDELRDSLIAAGGSASQLANLEGLLALERERIIAEAGQPIDDLLERIQDFGRSPAQQMNVLWSDLQDAVARWNSGDLGAAAAIGEIGDDLFGRIIELYGAGTAAARVMVDQLESQVRGDSSLSSDAGGSLSGSGEGGGSRPSSFDVRTLSVQEEQRDLLRQVANELAANRREAAAQRDRDRTEEGRRSAQLLVAVNRLTADRRAGAGR